MNTEHNRQRSLRKHSSTRIINGVCSGIAEYFQIDVSFVRFIFIVLTFFNLVSLILYVCFVIVFPNDTSEIDDDDDEQSFQIFPMLASGFILLGSLIFLMQINIPIFIHIWSLSLAISIAIFLMIAGLSVAYLVSLRFEFNTDNRTLMRSDTNRIISGVVGGLATYYDVDKTLLRAIFIFFMAVFVKLIPLFIIAYLIGAIALNYDHT
jgi:phage shock protein PspC (stress-responsive transcriptional regulator)